jgi:exopolysaccharide/PEP-CTERM locus tyrosine autokinase
VKLSQKGDFEKALMVTSSVPGEGKTITSLNLAIALAQEFDHTVLLVEADIRKPSMLNYLGIKAEKGLADCILDGLDVSEVLVKTGIGGLTVLPAGRRVDNPVELFSSNRMIALFDEIKSRYNDRYLIVDTTPLLPFAEPIYIANMIGAVVLVSREGMTTPENLNSSLELLKNHNLLGVVSNGVRRVNSGQGYYGAYGY